MKSLNEIVGENLTFLRKKAGFTQLEFGEKFSYSDKTVSKWENGSVLPSVDVLKQIADFYGVKKHLIIETNMEAIGGSALTDEKIEVPEGDVERTTVPVTYVPARNMIFLSYAMGYAEVVGATHVYIGVNSVDYSGYPDCRPEFIQRFQALADYATTATAVEGKKIRIETPLQELSKKEIVQLGSRLGAPLQFTHSCYKGGEKACGVCDSCKLRLQGFAEAGVEDPVAYETRSL